MELSTEEITRLNTILLNIGFEGEGGVTKAPNSYLLGEFHVTTITQTPESPNASTVQPSITTLFTQDLQDSALHALFESIGEFSQASLHQPKSLRMRSHYTDKELIDLLTRVGES